jgi:predicted 3-demethylubiquinone-9 3-methyltransferase (glyoxalase superfamily)
VQKITPFLWFDKQAEEAVEFYVSVFKDAKIHDVSRYDDATAKAAGMPAGTAMTVSFELHGQEFIALNGGPIYKFNEAVSFVVTCKDQDEIDYYWDKLSADPEAEQCGWLKDKYGLSWQVIPEDLPELISTPEAAAAMMSMKKIDVNKLRELAK